MAFTPSKVRAVEYCRQRREETQLRCSLGPSGCCRENGPRVGKGRDKRGSRETPQEALSTSCLKTIGLEPEIEAAKEKRSGEILGTF